MYKITEFIQLVKTHHLYTYTMFVVILFKVTSSQCEQEQISSTSFIQGHRYGAELEGKTDDVADGETDVLCVRFLLGQGM